MIWRSDISIESFRHKVIAWRSDNFLGDVPIDAQYALDLIFKTLVDDKEHYPFLTAMPESEKQTNSIMLHEILYRYSRKYRRFIKKERNEHEA